MLVVARQLCLPSWWESFARKYMRTLPCTCSRPSSSFVVAFESFAPSLTGLRFAVQASRTAPWLILDVKIAALFSQKLACCLQASQSTRCLWPPSCS